MSFLKSKLEAWFILSENKRRKKEESMPQITINGKKCEVKENSTLIEAFMQSSTDIAHYCWHPGLSVAGVCRMCLVEIEGRPKLEIACNIPVQDGMVVSNNSEKVKEAVKWGLEFHLINHPLDCPICDQAGECGLQEYFMTHGDYDSQMAEPKVKKRKVVDLGKRVVLDTERCILCSRCVRFTDEVSKTHELGIFQRGDHSEIGTVKDRPLNNNYSANVIDICPVGALTAKDFRFRQRVWFLKNFNTICQGCSTGCHIKVYFNENGLYRVTPVFNEKVNGHWMCDQGRDVYKFANLEHRLTQAYHKKETQRQTLLPGAAAIAVGQEIKALNDIANQVALVLTGQYTTEEYQALVQTFQDFGTQQIFHWQNNIETFNDFDGLLIRGDKNPNTKGLQNVLKTFNINKTWSELEELLDKELLEYLIVLGPENQSVYPDLKDKLTLFSKAKQVVWLAPTKNKLFEDLAWQIPIKSFIEKEGTFTNQAGLSQQIHKGPVFVSQALSGVDVATLMSGQPLKMFVNQVQNTNAVS